MAIIHPIDRKYVVTSVDNGSFLILGNVGLAESGYWRVAFVPDSSWIGGIAIFGRTSGKLAYDDAVTAGGVTFGSVSYRAVQVNAVAQDPTVVLNVGAAPAPLVNKDFIIYVPAGGLIIALGIDWTAGFGTLYTDPFLNLSV